ncbi:hypothetical protein Zm00014a_001177 [Zea mays]|nr:hypothetical protein Zm00014a_001177 [Zea mays]
MYWDKY